MAGRNQHTSTADRADAATDAFIEHRNLLFTIAYEMLGSAADAEDVLQETWLRWARVDLDTVRDRRAYLVRTTTRQALTQLRRLQRRKESYVGPWLPAPLLTTPDVAEDVALADGLSMAMLLVLETLTPTERAVFVLREVFGVEYDEIAAAVDKTPSAVRQIAHRARDHVAARRPRGQVSAGQTRNARNLLLKLGTTVTALAGSLAFTATPLAASAAPMPDESRPLQSTTTRAQTVGIRPAAQSYCVDNNHGAEACFQPYGDKVWVADYRANGYSAAAYWRTDYGRTGTCYDSTVDNNWHLCNYDMREGRHITLWAVNVRRSTNTWRYWSTGLTTII